MPGPWFIRELIEPAEVREAAEDVATWGYPRELEPLELAACTWFRMGKSVIWWYEPPHIADPEAAIVHLCIAPRARGQWPVRRWHIAAEVIAELMGANRLIFAPLEGDADMTAYALRCGWIPDRDRLEFRLGGCAWERSRPPRPSSD